MTTTIFIVVVGSSLVGYCQSPTLILLLRPTTTYCLLQLQQQRKLCRLRRFWVMLCYAAPPTPKNWRHLIIHFRHRVVICNSTSRSFELFQYSYEYWYCNTLFEGSMVLHLVKTGDKFHRSAELVVVYSYYDVLTHHQNHRQSSRLYLSFLKWW